MHRALAACANWFVIILTSLIPPAAYGTELPGFQKSPWFDEQVHEQRIDPETRVLVNAPAQASFDPRLPIRLIIYALPNGNTIEQTMGCQMVAGLDWHFDIQHIAAQTRKLRSLDADHNIVLACIEADSRSWPAWRKKHEDYRELIPRIVEGIKGFISSNPIEVVLACHSGGGSFIWGYLESFDAVPSEVSRFAILDANYSFSEEMKHGTKLLQWLEGDDSRHLVVLAYDDREITYQGKRVVGPTGGTYRATYRMHDYFQQHLEIANSHQGAFDEFRALDGRLQMFIHRNPNNKILHTALVGDMNGYLHALTLGTPLEAKWGAFAGPRAYLDWIQPAPEPASKPTIKLPSLESSGNSGLDIPPRATDALGGTQFFKTLDSLEPAAREAAIVSEVLAGNIPQFLRSMKTVRASLAAADGSQHTLDYLVMPDYLAVGHDDDFVRVPMTPMSAQTLADRFGCTLPTCKMVEQIYQQAELKLAPHPLTENREAPATFAQHNAIIQRQLPERPLGQLLAGIKKDVVISNRLTARPRRVAIFGWHQLNGQPIQTLTTVHVNTYVDYSHGIRLVANKMLLDGQATAFATIARDTSLCSLLSDEGVLQAIRY